MGARLRGLIAAVGALAAGALVSVAPAEAHVHATSPGAVRGGFAIVTFDVPNESPTGSATTELTVTLPNVASARTETKPGWSARLDRDSATGAFRAVTWTATGAGIGADEFGQFRIRMKLPDAETVSFPSAQRYADGTVVHWDQPPLPDGGEPERPAPVLALAAGPAAPAEHHAHPTHPAPGATASPEHSPAAESPGDGRGDNPARLLGGAALIVAAGAVVVAVTRRRT